jgi:cysteine desulfurase
MSKDVIYLDYNASTPCDPRVVEAMLPHLTETYANPSSRSHRPGRDAFSALEDARAKVARRLGARSPTEICFTSGATEANNLALRGVAQARADRGRHIVTQATEHPSVLEPLRSLQRNGWELTEVGVDENGRLRIDDLEKSLRDDTVLVSLMHANNETGTLQPVREAAALVHQRDALIHCDAAQSVGKVSVDVSDLDVDLLTLSGHKLYAPNGIGALYVRRIRPALKVHPLLLGGGHESGLRSGTPNLPGAAGLARALEIATDALQVEGLRIADLRDRLEASVVKSLEDCTINGATDHRLPGTTNLSFAGVEGNALLASLPDLAVSSGSACTSSHSEASPVLLAMGVAPALARASLRLSVGRFTSSEDVDRAAQRIVEEVLRLRSLGRRATPSDHE